MIIVCGLLAFYFFVYRSRRKEKILTGKYVDLLEKLKKVDEVRDEPVENDFHIKSIYSDEIIEEVKRNLKIFEEKKLFLDKDLKLPDVAVLVKCNRSILSFVLNEHLNISFYEYIKTVRINYITKKILEDKLYLKYSMDTLAAECGMKNRTLFSRHFLEINGIRPTDFVRKRQEELDNS
jgi:AraC-like DNA-binding protein